MPTILITGKDGQVGRALRAANWPADYSIVAHNRTTMDISNPDRVLQAVSEACPTLILNTAAYTAVDDAEDHEETAYAVNDLAVGYLADAARQIDCPVVHFSTDYVFDGSQEAEYTENDTTKPLNTYGASKLAGETRLRDRLDQHIILRISGVFDDAGRNFVRAILKAGATRPELSVIDDQTCGPTWSVDIAEAVVDIAVSLLENRTRSPARWGTYHFCSRPSISWLQFANEIFDLAAQSGYQRPQVRAIPGTEYPAKALRPRNPALDCRKVVDTFGVKLPDRVAALRAVVPLILADQSGAKL